MSDVLHNATLVLTKLEEAGFEAYFVGGCVRDSVLKLPVHDYDLTTSATPEQVAQVFPGTKLVGANFGVSLVTLNDHQFEVATFRTDGAYSDNRRPDSVAFTTDVREDVKRRDFTMNALLMDSRGAVLDFVGGLVDLQNKVLNTVGEPEDRFAEDALRLLRAVRFAARFGLTLHENVERAVRELSVGVLTLPNERVSGELTKMLTGGNVHLAFELMDRTGLLAHVFPQVVAMHGVDQNPLHHPEGDVWTHTMKLLAQLPAGCSLTLALAALLHDVAKPVTAVRNPATGHNRFLGHDEVGAEMARNMLRSLQFSNEVADTVGTLVDQHMQFFNVRVMKQSKLKKFVRQEHFAELLELNRLDTMASDCNMTDNDFAREFAENTPDEELRPVRLLTGHDLLDMGFKAGPQFKTLLSELETAQLEGAVTTRDEAVAFVEKMNGGDR